MVTDPQTHTNPPTGPITIHCAAASLPVEAKSYLNPSAWMFVETTHVDFEY